MDSYPVAVCFLNCVLVESAAERSLAQMGITIDGNLKRLSFLNVGSGNIYVGFGSVVTTAPTVGVAQSSVLLPGDGLSFNLNSADAGKLRFIASVDTQMNVFQEGD